MIIEGLVTKTTGTVNEILASLISAPYKFSILLNKMFVILYKCKCICNYIGEELYLINSSIVDAQLVLVVMIFIESVTFHLTISYVYNIDSIL